MKGEVRDIKLKNPKDDSYGDMEVIDLGENRFELAMNDLFDSRLTYGTQILVSAPDENRIYTLRKILSPSKYVQQVFVMDREFMSYKINQLAKLVADHDGHIESMMGGIVYINLPKDSSLDVADEIDRL